MNKRERNNRQSKETRQIALLGSTGSIGRNTLDVISQYPDQFNIIGLAGGENLPLLEKQARRFSPDILVVKHQKDAETLRRDFPGKTVAFGSEGLKELVNHPSVDTMVSAINGTHALEATVDSIRRGQRICLANKETLVAAGQLINRELAESTAEIIPIDSEQSAIFQALGDSHPDAVKKVILTASGGPFHGKNRAGLSTISIKQALAHPTWSMGTKITIDSATLMNKALEVIEAFYLFQLRKEQIDVIVHPQSIIHSMVEFTDASILAQLSVPDMRLPILYSLSFPGRFSFHTGKLDFAKLRKLEFFDVDRETFSSIPMAYHALEQGNNAGAVLNAANEVAVEYFLQEKIAFIDIFTVVESVFYKTEFHPLHSIGDVLETIEETKRKTVEHIRKRST